ncbi:MAG: T9SS type A sorting domain-containing protein [Saprospiraceae bacterium]|nr:T9SS type A sorting domain-containing protein [Saprospiraceae bacterium]
MKQLFTLLAFVTFMSTLAVSQITIYRADYTVSGVVSDNSIYRDIGTIGLNIPQRGAGRIYDYTSIKDTITTTNQVNTPAAAASLPALFKDATFLFRPRPTFGPYSMIDSQFLKLDTTGYYLLGYSRASTQVSISAQTGSTGDSLEFLPRTKRFTNPPFLIKFPMMSTTVSKILTIDTVPYKIKWVSAGYPTATPATHVRRLEYTTEVIGWGTLRMRSSIVGNPNLEFGVLFERYAELRLDSFFINNTPMPKRILDSFRLVQAAKDTAITYNLRGIGFKRGILQFRMSKEEAFITGANRVIEPSMNLLSDTKDLVSNDVVLTIFPNPITEGVNLEFEKKSNEDWQAVIFNEVGQIIDIQTITSSQGKVVHSVALNKSLPTGTYFVNILDERSLIRSKGKFVKVN